MFLLAEQILVGHLATWHRWPSRWDSPSRWGGPLRRRPPICLSWLLYLDGVICLRYWVRLEHAILVRVFLKLYACVLWIITLEKVVVVILRLRIRLSEKSSSIVGTRVIIWSPKRVRNDVACRGWATQIHWSCPRGLAGWCLSTHVFYSCQQTRL